MTRLLAVAIVVGMVGTASAQTRPLPPSRSLTTTVTGTIEPECFRELLAASRAWSAHTRPGILDWAGTLIQLGGVGGPAFVDFAQASNDLDLRLRKAVEAC